MQYRTLGRTGLKVSAITMGNLHLRRPGARSAAPAPQGVEDARRLVDLCIDHGVNMFDTANMYSTGLSEEILGEALQGKGDDVLVTSKARMRIGEGPNDEGASRYALIRECERSLKRAAARPHRPLLHPRMGRCDRDRGDDGGARHAGPAGQGPLCRLLQLLRLARDEGAGGGRPGRRRALHVAADPLHPGGPRGGVRAAAAVGRPGAGRAGVEPAGRRSPVRQSTGAARARRKDRARRPAGTSRRSATRTGCGGSSTAWRRSARRGECPPHR